MSKNTCWRILTVLALGHGNRADPNIALSPHALHELLEVRFPRHRYTVAATISFLSGYVNAGLVKTVPDKGDIAYQLTEVGYPVASRCVQLKHCFGHVVPIVRLPSVQPLASESSGLAKTSAGVWQQLHKGGGTRDHR